MTNEKKTSFFAKLEKRLASFLNEDVVVSIGKVLNDFLDSNSS